MNSLILNSDNSVFLELLSNNETSLVRSSIVETLRTEKEVFFQIFLKDDSINPVGAVSVSLKRNEILGLDNFTGDFYEGTRKVGRVGTELLQFAIQKHGKVTLTAVPKSVLFYLNSGFRPVQDLVKKKKYGPDIFAFNRNRKKENFTPEQFTKVPQKILKILGAEKGIDPTKIDYDFFLNNWWWDENDQPMIVYSLTDRMKKIFTAAFSRKEKPDFSKIPSIKMHLPDESFAIWRNKITGKIGYEEFRKEISSL